jgi:hypothetical protein
MKKFAKFISSLPFSGKIALGKLVFAVYFARTFSERKRAFIKVLVILILFLLGHTQQALMGFEGIHSHAPIWIMPIFFLYFLTNTGVVITQIYVTYRVTKFYLGNNYPKENKNILKKISEKSAKRMSIFTWLGQIIFIVPYIIYT